MSKNFQVLFRAERETQSFGAASLERKPLGTRLPCVRRPVPIDKAVQREETKLIERVFLVPGQQAPRVVVFCGVETPGGTVGICARAGQNLAEKTGLPVCLVDADLHAPALHDYFDVDNRFGIATAIFQSGAIRNYVQGLDSANLFLISAGQQTTASWKSDIWISCLNELRREFHYILIVAPPVARQTDTVLLAMDTDGVILVLESELTRRETARAVKERLDTARVTILGAVLNNRAFPIPEWIYRKL